LGSRISKAAEDLSLPSLAGHVPFGLICHPNKQHMLYPLGCTVVIQDLDSKKQVFLRGHTNNVSCIAVSRDGVYVASGEVAFMSFKTSSYGISRGRSYLLGYHFTRAGLKDWRFLPITFI
uniref:Uncharacterized protein n=1 Tax=Amazona collaria TaxID=241587 RepID=A0A8B9J214_9PSIT